MSCQILVLPGDGIGPEITPHTLNVLQAADKALGLDLTFETHDIGLKSLAEQGTTLSDATMTRIPEVDGVILGPVSHYDYPPRSQGGINPSAELRTKFELFANIRPCRSREGLTVLREPMDLVIVTTNMFGDILSDEASELTGSLGLGGAINASDTICVAQAQHGSAPDIAGQNVANPTSLILSVAVLLDWIGQRRNDTAFIQGGQLITRTIDPVLDNPATRTRDIGGTLGTDEFTAAVLAAMDDIG